MKKYVLPLLLAIAVGMLLGATGYCGLTFLACFVDGSPRQHPVVFPMSILGGFGCAAAAAVLIWCCVVFRKKYPSLPMTVAQVLLALASVPPGLVACIWFSQIFF